MTGRPRPAADHLAAPPDDADTPSTHTTAEESMWAAEGHGSGSPVAEQAYSPSPPSVEPRDPGDPSPDRDPTSTRSTGTATAVPGQRNDDKE